jgi:hypothetical protein
MARRASVRYYASRKAYFTHFEGRQIKLAEGADDAPKGPTYLAALGQFRQLMEMSNADTADQGNTVRVVVDLYGQHLERNGQSRSLEILLATCTSAVERFGDTLMGALKPVHVSGWLAQMAKPRVDRKKRTVKWGPTYQNMALRTLVAAFNWAKGQGLITAHCLQNSKAVVVRGRKRSRGQETYVPPTSSASSTGLAAGRPRRFTSRPATTTRPTGASSIPAIRGQTTSRGRTQGGLGRTGSSSFPRTLPGPSRPESRSIRRGQSFSRTETPPGPR